MLFSSLKSNDLKIKVSLIGETLIFCGML